MHVYVQAGLAKITVSPSVTFLAALSPSLTTAHISRSKSETWSMRREGCKRAPFSFHCPGDQISRLPSISRVF